MRLNKSEIEKKLQEVPGWQLMDKAIQRESIFRDFREAMAFVNHVAEIAENLDHHPDICIYYNKVVLSVYTHSEGGLTDKDFELARRVNQWLTS